jgi:uncharacterized protein YaiE (UPF0345 family)
MSMRFVRTAADTNGELVEVEATYQPGSVEPLAHCHPAQDERFEVLEGALRVDLAGSERAYGAGETLEVPRGTRHAMWNPGDAPARVRWETRPALRSEEFFELAASLAERGELTATGARSPLVGAAVMHEYRDVFRPVSPPAAVRAIAFPILAGIARMSGKAPRTE